MTGSKANPSTLLVHNSVGQATAARVESKSVEPSNTLITGGTFVTVEDGGMFQTHTYLLKCERVSVWTILFT